MKLNKTDFNILEDLLVKIGFGSYYDCIQMLRDIAYNIQPKLQRKLEKETDLLKIVNLISRLTKNKKKMKMSENKKVIVWCGGEYTLKEGETIDSVMKDYNEEAFDLDLNYTMITDLKGNILKEEKI